ncbi:hypothetical protein POTOM_038608 [Populus tomentosa]|uniref:Uncharacterized protein n=1 Tax=Populus tomentosa TaxID=118781 RepID=A0A8X8CL73_POPTO|nr:hypothetical protein POTOM_038608 [Populus tomentosa]
MGLWTLLEGFLLLANAFAILNEDRFLAPRGWSFSEFSVGRTNWCLDDDAKILYVKARNTLTGVDVFYARNAFEVAVLCVKANCDFTVLMGTLAFISSVWILQPPNGLCCDGEHKFRSFYTIFNETRSGCQVIGIMNSAYNHTIYGVQWKRIVISRAAGEYFEATLKDFQSP